MWKLILALFLACVIPVLQARAVHECQGTNCTSLLGGINLASVCRKLVGAIRSGRYGFKSGPVLDRLLLDTERACRILQTRGNLPNFVACQNTTQLAMNIAANLTANTTSICQQQDASLCQTEQLGDACGGPCSSSSQCGPGCYCNGYGSCDDACAPACQGETLVYI